MLQSKYFQDTYKFPWDTISRAEVEAGLEFHKAVENLDVERAEALLKQGVDPNFGIENRGRGHFGLEYEWGYHYAIDYLLFPKKDEKRDLQTVLPMLKLFVKYGANPVLAPSMAYHAGNVIADYARSLSRNRHKSADVFCALLKWFEWLKSLSVSSEDEYVQRRLRKYEDSKLHAWHVIDSRLYEWQKYRPEGVEIIDDLQKQLDCLEPVLIRTYIVTPQEALAKDVKEQFPNTSRQFRNKMALTELVLQDCYPDGNSDEATVRRGMLAKLLKSQSSRCDPLLEHINQIPLKSDQEDVLYWEYYYGLDGVITRKKAEERLKRIEGSKRYNRSTAEDNMFKGRDQAVMEWLESDGEFSVESLEKLQSEYEKKRKGENRILYAFPDGFEKVMQRYQSVIDEKGEMEQLESIARKMSSGTGISKEAAMAIVLRNHRKKLCRDLSDNAGIEKIAYVTHKMGLPLREGKKFLTKQQMCAQLAAYLIKSDFGQPEKTREYMEEMKQSEYALLKLAEEMGLDVPDQGLVRLRQYEGDLKHFCGKMIQYQSSSSDKNNMQRLLSELKEKYADLRTLDTEDYGTSCKEALRFIRKEIRSVDQQKLSNEDIVKKVLAYM